jgi:hypothetical protein
MKVYQLFLLVGAIGAIALRYLAFNNVIDLATLTNSRPPTTQSPLKFLAPVVKAEPAALNPKDARLPAAEGLYVNGKRYVMIDQKLYPYNESHIYNVDGVSTIYIEPHGAPPIAEATSTAESKSLRR